MGDVFASSQKLQARKSCKLEKAASSKKLQARKSCKLEKAAMFIWGTANPCGEENETYKGLYLRHRDIDSFIREMPGKPVKVEHTGPEVGRVLHAWKNKSNGLDCILEINREGSVDGSVIASLVNEKCARDLSLGYRVRMDMSSSNNAHLEKEVVEVSIVKRGLRPDCHIHAYSSQQKKQKLV